MLRFGCLFSLLAVLYAHTIVDTQLPGGGSYIHISMGGDSQHSSQSLSGQSHNGSIGGSTTSSETDGNDTCTKYRQYNEILATFTHEPCKDIIQGFMQLADLKKHHLSGKYCVARAIQKMADAASKQGIRCACSGHIYKHNYPRLNGLSYDDCRHSDNGAFRKFWNMFYQEGSLGHHYQQSSSCHSLRKELSDLNSMSNESPNCQLSFIEHVDSTYSHHRYKDHCSCTPVREGPGSIHFSPAHTSFTRTEGSTLEIRCSAYCYPNCSFIWIKVRDNYHNYEVSTQAVLTFANLRTSDAGTYKCTAINPYTKRYNSGRITVHVAPSASTTEATSTSSTRKSTTAQTSMPTTTVTPSTTTLVMSTTRIKVSPTTPPKPTVTQSASTAVTVLVGLHVCPKLSTIQDIAQHHASSNVNASLCTSGEHKSPDAFVLNHCTVPSHTLNWSQGYKVMDHCDSIPTYTPVATFSFGQYIPSTGICGVFLGCLQNGFKLGVQLCNHSPTIVHVEMGGINNDNPQAYYTIQ